MPRRFGFPGPSGREGDSTVFRLAVNRIHEELALRKKQREAAAASAQSANEVAIDPQPVAEVNPEATVVTR